VTHPPTPEERDGRAEIASGLLRYVEQEILEGDEIGLDEATPLLEWGVLNSFEILRLAAFVEERFGIDVIEGGIDPERFVTIGALADFIDDARGTVGRAAGGP
jgi:acyl carrier protein